MCDEHVPKVSSPTSPPLPPIQVHHPNRVLPNLIKVSSPTAPPLPPIQGHHPNRILPNLMTQEDRIKASKREKKNHYRKLYRLRQKRKRDEKIRFVARRRARRREEKQKLKDEEQKLNARRIEEEQKKVIQLNKNEISKNAETETSNNSSLPAANECDSETSFNDTSTHSERNGGVPATIEETTTFSLCDSIDKIAPAKKALEFLTTNKGLGMNLKKVNHYEPTPRYNEHFPTCEQKVHMRCVRDSRGIVKYTHRCHDDSGIYDNNFLVLYPKIQNNLI